MTAVAARVAAWLAHVLAAWVPLVALTWDSVGGAPGARTLNPRIKVGRLAVLGVLPARMPHADAQKAHIAQGYGRHSSHESSHGSQAEPGRIRHSK